MPFTRIPRQGKKGQVLSKKRPHLEQRAHLVYLSIFSERLVLVEMWNSGGGPTYNHNQPHGFVPTPGAPPGSYSGSYSHQRPSTVHTRPPTQSAGGEMTWEEMYDSGQLDVHLKNQLTISSAPTPSSALPPIHPYMMNGGSSQPQPLMSIVTRPPSAIQHRPNIARRPPPPSLPTMADPFNPFTQPPPPIRNPVAVAKRPQIMKRPTNYKPTGGSVSTGKLPTKIQSEEIKVEVQIQEEHPRTQYRPPEPKVKILKRPSSTPSNLYDSGEASSNADSPSYPSLSPSDESKTHKSLRQREEEYAQARLRILGSAEPTISVEPSVEQSAAQTAYKSEPSNVVRLPKGPDGTKGFAENRR